MNQGYIPVPPAYGPTYSEPTAEQELQMLKGEADALKAEVEGIEARMTELKKQEQVKK
jgi:hypothetical protein